MDETADIFALSSPAENFERIKSQFGGFEATITQAEFLVLKDEEAEILIKKIQDVKSKAQLRIFRLTGNLMRNFDFTFAIEFLFLHFDC